MISKKWTGLLFVTASFSFANLSFAALPQLPIDGSETSIMAEKPEAPQQKDGTYAYTKSASFNRLVYNNWAPPVFEDKILTIASKADSSRRAVLISEINLDSKHLKSDKSYKLSLKNLYSCAKQGEESSPCHLKTMVRCYGKVKDGSWGVTHESIRATKAKFADNGVFKQVQTIKAKDCKNGIHLSLEGSAIPNLASYGFRGMKVALQEL